MDKLNVSFDNNFTDENEAMRKIYNITRNYLIADCKYDSIGSVLPKVLNVTQDVTIDAHGFNVTATRFEGMLTDRKAICNAVNRANMTMLYLKESYFDVKFVSVKYIDGKHKVHFQIESTYFDYAPRVVERIMDLKKMMEESLETLLDRFAITKGRGIYRCGM